MPVTPPSRDDLRATGRWYGLELSESELDAYGGLMGVVLASCERLEQLDGATRRPAPDRDPGRRPAPEENALNAWYRRCSVRGAPSAPLAGRTIGIKDNVCVAGIPMTVGTPVLEGFVPEVDAVVVERILAAGGEIVGKTVCEPLCISDGSHLAGTGPVRNPHDPSRSAGGSSSGSAALVVAGGCDLAIGTDTAGSVRMPASLCGAFGLKPTHGLVPTDGVVPIERTLDHVGPIGTSARDVAVLLEVMAGRGGRADEVVAGLETGIDGLRIGLVDEGFGRPGSDPAVDEAVRAAAATLGAEGAHVTRVSIPWHPDGEHVWGGIALEGAVDGLLRGNGARTNVDEVVDLGLVEALGRGRAERADLLSEPVKLVLLAGEHLRRQQGGTVYARARRLVPELRRAYDDALTRVDVLVMPTTPTTAPPLPPPDAPIEARVAAAFGPLHANTCPLNATGHPAISIPCGLADGLPVGMMAVAAAGEDGLLLRLARACEVHGVSPLPPRRAPA